MVRHAVPVGSWEVTTASSVDSENAEADLLGSNTQKIKTDMLF